MSLNELPRKIVREEIRPRSQSCGRTTIFTSPSVCHARARRRARSRKGLIRMLSEVDVGPLISPDGDGQSGVADLRNWTETCRRLFVPYYEEARLYFDEAQADGAYEGHSEISPFIEDKMLRMIRKYGRH